MVHKKKKVWHVGVERKGLGEWERVDKKQYFSAWARNQQDGKQ